MITNLRYADDIILLATSEAELQELVDTPMPSSDVSGIGQCGLAIGLCMLMCHAHST